MGESWRSDDAVVLNGDERGSVLRGTVTYASNNVYGDSGTDVMDFTCNNNMMVYNFETGRYAQTGNSCDNAMNSIEAIYAGGQDYIFID